MEGLKGTTHLKLPVFKSNIPGDKVFSNNTHFISNTKAFYDDLNLKLQYNEQRLEQLCMKSIDRINKHPVENQNI